MKGEAVSSILTGGTLSGFVFRFYFLGGFGGAGVWRIGDVSCGFSPLVYFCPLIFALIFLGYFLIGMARKDMLGWRHEPTCIFPPFFGRFRQRHL